MGVELGLGKNSITRWDENKPSVDRVQKVADYFGVSVDYLLGRTDDPTPKATAAAIGYGSKEYVIRGLSKEEFEELQNYLEYQRSKAKK